MKLVYAALALLISVPTLACIALDTPLQLSGSTFEGETLLFSDDGDFIFDNDKVSYNLKEKRWYVSPNGDKSKKATLISGSKIPLTNKSGKVIGVAYPLPGPDGGQTLLFMSVDSKGEIDKNKPYLRINNLSKIENGKDGSNVKPIVEIDAFENSKVIGTAKISGGHYSVEADGSLSSMYRGLPTFSPNAPKPLELKDHEITSGTCGKAPESKALTQRPARLIVGPSGASAR